MIRLLVCGSRFWTNYEVVEETLAKIERIAGIECLIEGGCQGADDYAFFVYLDICHSRHKLPKVHEVLPDWRRYGRSAGPIRNQQMLELSPDIVLCFHNNLENSWGAKDMVRRAIKAGVPVILISDGTEMRYEDDNPDKVRIALLNRGARRDVATDNSVCRDAHGSTQDNSR